MVAINFIKKIMVCDLACFCCEGRIEKDCLLGEGKQPLVYYIVRSFLFKEIELKAQGLWKNNLTIDAQKEGLFPPVYKTEKEN